MLRGFTFCQSACKRKQNGCRPETNIGSLYYEREGKEMILAYEKLGLECCEGCGVIRDASFKKCPV